MFGLVIDYNNLDPRTKEADARIRILVLELFDANKYEKISSDLDLKKFFDTVQEVDKMVSVTLIYLETNRIGFYLLQTVHI